MKKVIAFGLGYVIGLLVPSVMVEVIDMRFPVPRTVATVEDARQLVRSCSNTGGSPVTSTEFRDGPSYEPLSFTVRCEKPAP